MSDRLHDHTTIGFRRGCVACAQTEADLALSARAYWKIQPVLTEVERNAPHPESGSYLRGTVGVSTA